MQPFDQKLEMYRSCFVPSIADIENTPTRYSAAGSKLRIKPTAVLTPQIHFKRDGDNMIYRTFCLYIVRTFDRLTITPLIVMLIHLPEKYVLSALKMYIKNEIALKKTLNFSMLAPDRTNQ